MAPPRPPRAQHAAWHARIAASPRNAAIPAWPAPAAASAGMAAAAGGSGLGFMPELAPGGAPRASSTATASSCPRAAAQCSGVRPCMSCARGRPSTLNGQPAGALTRVAAMAAARRGGVLALRVLRGTARCAHPPPWKPACLWRGGIRYGTLHTEPRYGKASKSDTAGVLLPNTDQLPPRYTLTLTSSHAHAWARAGLQQGRQRSAVAQPGCQVRQGRFHAGRIPHKL